MNTPDKNLAIDIKSVANDRQRHNPLNPEMVDSLFDMAFKKGLFEKIDDGVYASKLYEEIKVPIDNLKSLLENGEYLDDATIVQFLTDAYINAQQFVHSDLTADYLDSIGMTQENINDLILNDVQAILTHLALRFGVEHFFLENVKSMGGTGAYTKHKTMPYGQRAIDDKGKQKPRIPVISFGVKQEAKETSLADDPEDYTAVNIEDAIRQAERKTTQQGMPAVQMPNVKHTSSGPPQRATLPPPPMTTGCVDVNVEALDTEKRALKFFKTIFVDFVKKQYLRKLRDLKKSYTEAGKTEDDCNIFKDTFAAICKKAYSMVGVDNSKRAEEIIFHKYVDNRTSKGENWEEVIEKLASKIMADEAMETMSHYLPLVTRALLSNESYKKKIIDLDLSDNEKHEKELGDAALKVCLFIKEQLFKPNTGEKLRDVAFLGFYFIEDREDLNLILYTEARKFVEEVFTEIRSKTASITPDSSAQSIYFDPNASGEIEPIPATVRGLDSEFHQFERDMEAQIEATDIDAEEAGELLRLYGSKNDNDVESIATTPAPVSTENRPKVRATSSVLIDGKEPETVINGTIEEGDEDDDTDVFVVGGRREVLPKKVMPAAGRPADKPVEAKPVTKKMDSESYRQSLRTLSDRPKVEPYNIAISENDQTREEAVFEERPTTPSPKTESEKSGVKQEQSWWSKVKKSKAAKIAAGVAFAATTALASYGVINYANKNNDNDTTEPTAASSVSTSNNDSKPAVKVASNETTEDLNKAETNEHTSVNKTPPPESENLYTVHLDRIAGNDARLKTLVEEESFVRHPGNRGDFEQLHSIIAQSGAMTDKQIRNIQDNLNEKFNRGEYGAATRRFRPLLENGTLFEVLRTPSHPEHQALKAAIEKFGNPSRWTWTRKKLVKVDGKAEFKSMPYEEMYAQDVEFFDKCQEEFAQVGIGKNGNIHINGGEAGERIPLKINGRWLTFVETALQIRGIVERNGADVPAPPADLLDHQPNMPAHDVPADNVPTNFSPNGGGTDGGTYGLFDAPTIEMGEPLMMRKADLENDPEIDFGVATGSDLNEIEMAEIDAGWDLEVKAGSGAGLNMGRAMNEKTVADNELAEIDNEWGNIIDAIDKRVEQVKRAA